METIIESNTIKKELNLNRQFMNFIGEIPSNWRTSTLGNLIQNKSIKNKPEEQVLSVYRDFGVIPKDSRSDNHNATGLDTSNYKFVEPGDLVVNKMKAWQGSMGVSTHYGIVSPAYITCRIISNEINPFYLHLLLRSSSYIEEFSRLSYGVREGQWDMHFEDFKKIITLLPPLPEQTRIAEFLNRKTAQIDKAIAQKQRMIELLKERRQILIQNAVTKGLNPNVKMKDSGVEWIGEIPEHWEVRRLKCFIKDLESGVSVNASETEAANDEEIGVLKTSSVYSYSFNNLANKKVFKSDLKRVSCSVKKGRIIISRMNAPELVGASGYVTKSYPNLYLPDRLWQTIYHPNAEFDPFWLSIILTTISFRAVITSLANGSSPSMKNISKSDFLNVWIPFPNYEEQLLIVNSTEIQSSKIDKTIALQQTQIEKLKVYRATLINSAVTGKIKV